MHLCSMHQWPPQLQWSSRFSSSRQQDAARAEEDVAAGAAGVDVEAPEEDVDPQHRPRAPTAIPTGARFPA